MKTRLLLLASMVPLSAFAQLQVFVYSGSSETLAVSPVHVGSAAVGDTLDTKFGVRNMGAGPATLQPLAFSGFGFTLSGEPAGSYVIAPGQEATFHVAFNPTALGNYNASVTVNGTTLNIVATAVAAAVLSLAGSSAPIGSGTPIDFGSVLAGGSKTLSFTLSNTGTASLTVQKITVSGAAFSGPAGLTTPSSLAAGQTASFQVTFAPLSGQSAQGTLIVDQRSFALTGQGLNPPLPSATIALASTLGASGQQNTVSIPLASASQVSGTGTLTLAFRPAVPGISDDPAIQFLAGAKRAATVSISPGDTAARFNGQTGLAFQTGTTAGTITFTLTLGNSAPQQATLNIAPSAVVIDTAGAVRRVNDLDISITGFDNTYSASQFTFTFFDKSSKPISPGAIVVDATSNFRQYFASSQAGGTFALLATFPVYGDVTQITGFTLSIANSAGVGSTQTVSF